MSKGGCYIKRSGGKPKEIAIRLRNPIEKFIKLPVGSSEEDAERVRKACAEALAAGTLDLSAAIKSRIAERDQTFPEEMPEVASVGEVRVYKHSGLASLPESPGVYFIQVKVGQQRGPVKIGVSSTGMRSRTKDIACGFPWPIVALGWSDGGADDEAAAHHALRKHRMNGEWFMPDPVVLEFVKMASEVGVRRAIEAADWFKKTPEAKQKESRASFDMKAYRSWIRGESDGPPPLPC